MDGFDEYLLQFLINSIHRALSQVELKLDLVALDVGMLVCCYVVLIV